MTIEREHDDACRDRYEEKSPRIQPVRTEVGSTCNADQRCERNKRCGGEHRAGRGLQGIHRPQADDAGNRNTHEESLRARIGAEVNA